MTTRLIPTAVAGFAVLFLGTRALSVASNKAYAEAGASPALNATDATLSTLGYTASVGVPIGMLVAAFAMVLAIGYLVVG